MNILQIKNGKSVCVSPNPSNSKSLCIARHFVHFINVEHLTNVTIRDDSRAYKINVVILTACSPKFKDLFVDKNHDYSKDIVVTNLKTDCLGHVLEFLYTGRLTITKDTIEDTLSICYQLDLPLALQECVRFLRCHDVTCALDYLTIAMENQLEIVVNELAIYIRQYKHFILQDDAFLTLNADCIFAIIGKQLVIIELHPTSYIRHEWSPSLLFILIRSRPTKTLWWTLKIKMVTITRYTKYRSWWTMGQPPTFLLPYFIHFWSNVWWSAPCFNDSNVLFSDASDDSQSDDKNEQYILHKVLKWLQHDEEERKIHSTKLLTAIRWKKIPVSIIADVVDENSSWFQSNEINDILYEAYRWLSNI